MTRSGLHVVDAQAKLAASLDTAVASTQVLERGGDLAGASVGQIEQATMQPTRQLRYAVHAAIAAYRNMARDIPIAAA